MAVIRCHGAVTMIENPLLPDKSGTKVSMWGGFVCNRCYLILFLINIIVLQSLIYYQERCKCQDVKTSLVSIQETMEHIYTLNQLEKHLRDSNIRKDGEEKPTIFAITPTFARPVQKAELTRLSQTFLHVPNFHWIVVEDSAKKTKLVSQFLEESGLMYTHLAAATPPNYKLGKNDPHWKKPRGVEQRNLALRWIRENLTSVKNGIVYFADDDNTYSVKLFREMEKIQKVGVWPVGLVGGLMVEKPICDNSTNKVIGFNAAWKPDRPFPLDMAGFAINLTLLLENNNAMFSYDVQGGYQESEILMHIVKRDELEPLADCCTKVYVWHTRTEPPLLNVEQLLIRQGRRSNVGIEV